MTTIPAARLTMDDLEAIAFRYGGTIVRDLSDDTHRLVDALIGGRLVTLGPVPGPVQVEAARLGVA